MFLPLRFVLSAALFLALLFGPGLAPATGSGTQATFDEVVVTNTSRDILLYCTLRNGFSAKMVEGIKNGIPVTFTFFVELDRVRAGLPDASVANHRFNHQISYDALKNEYRVIHEEQQGKVLTTTELGEALKWMARVNGFPVAPLGALSPDGEYILRIRARLAEKNLPLAFHYLIPFWSLWDFETDWHEVRFRY